METIKLLNEAVRFLLELCILIIFGYWGFKTGNSTLTKILLGIGSPLLFAVIWGIFLAPKSATRLQEPWLLIVEIILFGITAWALYNTGKVSLAIVFAVIYILNKFLMILWRQ